MTIIEQVFQVCSSSEFLKVKRAFSKVFLSKVQSHTPAVMITLAVGLNYNSLITSEVITNKPLPLFLTTLIIKVSCVLSIYVFLHFTHSGVSIYIRHRHSIIVNLDFDTSAVVVNSPVSEIVT